MTNKNVDPASAHADVKKKKKKKKKKKETKKDEKKKKEAKKEEQRQKEEKKQKEEDNPSSIAEHVQSTGHKMDWKNFRILWRDSNTQRLMIKESLVIRAHEPRLNRTTHSVPLLIFPEGLERHLVPDPNG